ncbi:MAG: gliding motility-associated C-terminal domain-containing protein [Bacteroidota bacterium]
MYRKIFTTLFLLTASIFTYGQSNYLISTGGTISTCSGFFYDSGLGSAANYGNNQNLTMTFCAGAGVNTHIQVYFNEFDVDPSDTLYIYDGNSVNPANLIGAYNNTNSLELFPVQATISNSSGCLTFRFKSNGTGVAAGWKGTVSCVQACQKVFSDLDSVNMIPRPVDSNYINICLGDTITFKGSAIFPQNGLVYQQDTSTCTYIWNFGDGTIDTGRVIKHNYGIVKGYEVSLTVIDVNGCVSTNFLGCRVRVSGNPIGSIKALPDICSSSDSIEITVGYDPSSIITIKPIASQLSASQGFDSTLFIPDGPNCPTQCYNTNVSFTAFTPGQTIQSAADILSICVNMEHSFVGDLEFTITCPDGKSAILKEYIGTSGGGAFMGVPNETDGLNECVAADNAPGIGWEYCWSNIYPNIGTIEDNANQTTLDSTNRTNNTGYYLPNEPLTQLVGCPLNGLWNIEICDAWGSDNGYIFSWDLNLDPDLLPTGWGYEVGIDSLGWSGSFIEVTTDSSIIVLPDSGGLYDYTLTIYDKYGCSYDTTLYVNVIETPVVKLPSDTTLCQGQTLTLNPNYSGANTYHWSTSASTETIIVNSDGNYSITATNSIGPVSCWDRDSILVAVVPMPLADLGPDICTETGSHIFYGDASSPSFTYNWSDGSTNSTYTATSSGMVTVEIKSGQYCIDKDTVNVKVFPAPASVDLGEDQSICSHQSVNLDATQANEQAGFIYQWHPSGANSSTLVFKPGVAGTFVIKVDKIACTTVYDSVTITSINCEVTAPNVFTPNGDGINDQLVFVGLNEYPGSKLLVFNRWGKKVYQNDSYNNDWDGDNSTDGTYYYILSFPVNTLPTISGTVNIMRDGK